MVAWSSPTQQGRLASLVVVEYRHYEYLGCWKEETIGFWAGSSVGEEGHWPRIGCLHAVALRWDLVNISGQLSAPELVAVAELVEEGTPVPARNEKEGGRYQPS